MSTSPSSWKVVLLASASGIAGNVVLSPRSVQAQTADEATMMPEEVVVTGSRVQRSGFDTPTPVSVLNEDEIDSEAPGSVAEFVMTLPSVQGSETASTSSGSLSSGNAGIAALNLRNLGEGRTLVLLDGQRSVVSGSSGQVDTNTFPQPLVESVEVVTGGASSAYGSDAISGVVNFILDTDFTGIESSVQYGQTTYEDNQSEKYTFNGGTPFDGGKGHMLFSTELYDSEGIHYKTREWSERGHFAIPNPDTSPGAPDYIVSEGVGISAYTPGGLITSGPLKGTYFGQGGAVNQLEYGEVAGQWMRGGDWRYTTSGMLGTNSLAADDRRESVFGRASYMITPSIEVFGQASWARYKGYSHYINPTSRDVTIYRDNAFLPDAVGRRMDEEGIDSFTMATSNADMPASGSNNVRDTTRFVIGANGDFEAVGKSWSWDSYYQHGVTNTDEHQLPTFHFARLEAATDAVADPETGEIVCRSTLSMPGNGCVPLNRFGVGVASEEALNYVLGRPRREQEFQQDVAAVNFTTNDFVGWAGPVSLAFGAEWRNEQMAGFVAPEYGSGWKYGNYQVTEGQYTVREIYGETVVPLMDTLEFNAAARYTDYSTSGGVRTWKAGLTYTPIDALTFRVTKSRDIRAPNLSELYDKGTARTNAVAIDGMSVPFIQNLQGTTSVNPEEAQTVGLGVILQPGFLPNFTASIDYYEIEIDGVIDFVGAQDVTDFCFKFNVQRYCDQMNYVDGELRTIDLYYENLNSMNAKGVDYEASYSVGADELFGRGTGQITVRALATNYIDDITDDGVTATDSAGQNTGSTPDWVHRITAQYALDTWLVNLTARGVSDGVIDNDFIECTSNCPETQPPNYTINDNSVDGEVYFDLYVSKNLTFGGVDTEFFLSVKNMLDTDPVLVDHPGGQGAENAPGYVATNRNLYDVLGRNLRLGMRLQF